ncbi:MAG: hypothetical protein Q8O67_14020 [Deltaproteobacteria bacterium]|nr:hypothetical protein [Deltaproteobacteria bacterium]
MIKPLCSAAALLFSLAVVVVVASPARAQEAEPAAPVAPPAPAVEPAPAATETASKETASKESNCSDHADDDGDAVIDCGDADCAAEAHCIPDGKPESTNAKCSDWIDNDGDGAIDCEDKECQLSSISVCDGSWQGDVEGDGGDGAPGPRDPANGTTPPRERLYQGDVEQPDSEGGVGFVGVRFGVVAAVQQLVTTTNINDPFAYDTRIDTRFDTLQLRAFGALPLLEDSFFLLSMAAAQSPRISFAMFQFPLGAGHYVNLNSGGSTLSAQPLVSAAKRPLLDTPRYLLNPFDQFLDAGVELNGPIVLNLLRYRVFAGGGTGLFGDFGGRRFEDASANPTFSAGTQVWMTPVGIYNRFDSPFLYRPVPMAVAFALGGKYEQREQERFPAVHAVGVFRYGLLSAQFESYNKAELNFGALQTANYLQVGFLLWPEWFFVAADVGQFYTSGFGEAAKYGIPIAGKLADVPNALKRNRIEYQARAALHWFFWRQNGVMSVRYTFDSTDPIPLGAQADRTFAVVSHEAVLQAQIRF